MDLKLGSGLSTAESKKIGMKFIRASFAPLHGEFSVQPLQEGAVSGLKTLVAFKLKLVIVVRLESSIDQPSLKTII